MKVECAWCGKSMGEKPPLENKEVSHGICKTCYGEQLATMDPNRPWTVTEHDLAHAAHEENLAARVYRLRAATAKARGDFETAKLFEHIASEEDVHENEFNARRDNLRNFARQIARQVAES